MNPGSSYPKPGPFPPHLVENEQGGSNASLPQDLCTSCSRHLRHPSSRLSVQLTLFHPLGLSCHLTVLGPSPCPSARTSSLRGTLPSLPFTAFDDFTVNSSLGPVFRRHRFAPPDCRLRAGQNCACLRRPWVPRPPRGGWGGGGECLAQNRCSISASG